MATVYTIPTRARTEEERHSLFYALLQLLAVDLVLWLAIIDGARWLWRVI
jgi:hypothetical protein